MPCCQPLRRSCQLNQVVGAEYLSCQLIESFAQWLKARHADACPDSQQAQLAPADPDVRRSVAVHQYKVQGETNIEALEQRHCVDTVQDTHLCFSLQVVAGGGRPAMMPTLVYEDQW